MTLEDVIQEAADEISKAFMEAALKVPQEIFCKTFCSHHNGVANDS